jgi:hypothetical protein
MGLNAQNLNKNSALNRKEVKIKNIDPSNPIFKNF